LNIHEGQYKSVLNFKIVETVGLTSTLGHNIISMTVKLNPTEDLEELRHNI